MTAAIYPSLAGRTIIVTGGASGIGAAIVSDFVRQGCRVAFLDRDRTAGQALCAALDPGDGRRPLFVDCDLTDIQALGNAMAEIEKALGPASVLVNNAACDERQDFLDIDVDTFDWMMAVNLRHVVFASQAVAVQMKRLGFGSIINLTSVAWMRGVADMQLYSAAKAAIVGFTNSLSRQLGADHIRVNAIAPGLVLTARQREKWFADEGRIVQATSAQALPDPITPEDVSALALFLAADDSRMITKQCIAVNAGSL